MNGTEFGQSLIQETFLQSGLQFLKELKMQTDSFLNWS